MQSNDDNQAKKGIDGIYTDSNPDSDKKYIISEARYWRGYLKKTKDGLQMSDNWIFSKDRILKAANGDKELADDILDALENGQVEKTLSMAYVGKNIKVYKLNREAKVVGIWP
ncbi:hypothetical protein [Defluviitalea phaphyphila]|uniref:hypothetical protein n=1 Tax=Defluviitalea phaphyphila TaxID=1473580 RepID=UPI00072FC3D4|nr:hypothetical protein [Defluviitalea phaphyphila]